MQKKLIGQIAVGAALICAGSNAFADWAFDLKNKASAASVTSTAVSGGSSVTATVTALSVANNMVTTLDPGYTTRRTTTEAFGAGTTFAAATLSGYATGLGVRNSGENTSSPNHATDNSGRTDMILFSFGAGNKFILDTLSLGWVQNDADITLLRYVGTGGPGLDATPNWNNMKVDGAGNGWEVVQNVNYTGGSTTQTVTLDVNNGADPKSSSWWIVSAFNTSFGEAANGADAGYKERKQSGYWNVTSDYRDYFKLAGLTGTFAPPESNGVPEPGSLALLGLAALGLLGTRRRKKQQG